MQFVNSACSRLVFLVHWSVLILLTFYLLSCKPTKIHASSTVALSHELPLAFPGAEGYGKFTTGGRGGRVMIVENLNDDGTGSFRAAAEADFPRVIVFAISGTIHLNSKIKIKSNATIAGQSAPGAGICLADQSVLLGGDNIIVRFLRFRMGDKYQKGGMVNGNGGDDAFGGFRRNNIIIDHCSFSWSTDEVFSIYAGDSTSVQWNLIAEPLNYSYHFETGDTDYEHHGFGGIWGGVHASFHHNLFAHCNSRTPRFNGIRHTNKEYCDFRNNVIYNWGGNNVYGGEGGTYNIVNNYYKPGPSTSKKSTYQMAVPYRRKDIPYGKWFVSGNTMEGNAIVSQNNLLGVKLNEPTKDDKFGDVFINKAFDFMEIKTQQPEKALEDVLAKAGCVYPERDTLDQRIVDDVVNGRGRLIDVQGGYPHGTDYELTENAWPSLFNASVLTDTDRDGMPDAWEIAHRLNPSQNDANGFQLQKRITNIEVYLNGLVSLRID